MSADKLFEILDANDYSKFKQEQIKSFILDFRRSKSQLIQLYLINSIIYVILKLKKKPKVVIFIH